MIKYIIGFIIVYLASAFIQADFDFRNWSVMSRFLTFVIFSSYYISSEVIKHFENEY